MLDNVFVALAHPEPPPLALTASAAKGCVRLTTEGAPIHASPPFTTMLYEPEAKEPNTFDDNHVVPLSLEY